MKRLVDVKGIV